MTARAGRRGLSSLREPVPGQLNLLEPCLPAPDQALLDFARRHHFTGRVDARAQHELGCSPTRYYQQLTRMLDRPDIAAAAPDLIDRLHALRDQRTE